VFPLTIPNPLCPHGPSEGKNKLTPRDEIFELFLMNILQPKEQDFTRMILAKCILYDMRYTWKVKSYCSVHLLMCTDVDISLREPRTGDLIL